MVRLAQAPLCWGAECVRARTHTHACGWGGWLPLTAGLLPTGLRPTVESALGFLAGLSGRREDLDVTLRFDQGFVFLGPLPVGEGPRIRLR